MNKKTMPPLENLSFPQLIKVSNGEQSLEIDSTATKLVSSVDASFGAVDVSDLASRTQKITSDGTSTFISGDLNLESGNLNVQGDADTTLQSNIDSEASTRASADTTLQSNIDALSSSTTVSVTALETKTQLVTSTADTATFSGKLSWGTDKFFSIKAREEVSVLNFTTLTKALDMSHSYSIDGVKWK